MPLVEFDLEQVRSLASPIRSEVFWSFRSHEPFSVSEVAKLLGKSAQTVHYHVNELVRVNLLIAVSERKQYARTEKLYVPRGVTNLSRPASNTREYRDEVVRGFAALARTMAKEHELANAAMDFDPDVSEWMLYRRALLRVDASKMAALKKRLREVMEDVSLYDVGPEGTMIHISVYASPTIGTSRDWLKQKGKDLPEED